MRNWLFLFGCNLMWALQFTCVKLVQDQMGSLFTVWGPMTLATLMLYPHVWLEQRDRGKTKTERRQSDILLFLVLAAVGVFPGQVLITWGTRISTATNAALLMLTLPISTAILAVIFLRERMNSVRWMSFALAIAGVAMCSLTDLKGLSFAITYLFGNVLIFVGTLGSAFYNSYGKKVLERYSPMEMLFFTYIAMFVIMTPLVFIREGRTFGQISGFTLQTWVGLILLTVFQNYLSMVLFLKALKQLDAIQAALSNYLITFFGVPIAAIWLKEKLTPLTLVGGLIILGSTLMITLWEAKRAPAGQMAGASARPVKSL